MEREQRVRPQRRWQDGLGPKSVVLLLGAFCLMCGSAFQATAHDAFMTLPPYTSTREGEVHQLGSGPKPCRPGLGVRKGSQVDFLIVEHRSVLHSREGDCFDAYSECQHHT